jgi:protein O-mannosyl-transferase
VNSKETIRSGPKCSIILDEMSRERRLPQAESASPVASIAPEAAAFERNAWLLNWAAIAVLALITLAAYWSSFKGVFLFDDIQYIVDDPPRIAQPWWAHLTGFYLAGQRNLVTLSLIANHAAAGLETWGYHAFNFTVHLIAGLALFGFTRRTLLTPLLRERFEGVAAPLAFCVAALFLIHPLQTESVTYVIQRAQSMMGMFQFLAIYCVARGFVSKRMDAWHFAALLCCVFGLDVKPHMIGMPALILLYDRTFVSRSFGEAFSRSKLLYLGLVWVWVVNVGNLARGLSQLDIGSRGANPEATAGDMTIPEYGLSQFYSACLYLKLSVWPHPLCLDYTLHIARETGEILPYAIVVLGLGLATLWGMWRLSAWGFIGAWFFLNLGPSSSIIRRPDLAVEHRMYVPLAAVIAAMIFGGYYIMRSMIKRIPLVPARDRLVVASWIGIAALISGFAYLTYERNNDYASSIAMWSSVVRLRPGNPRAQNNLGLAYFNADKLDEAENCFRESLRINPNYWPATYDLGLLLERRGDIEQAIAHYIVAVTVQFKPGVLTLANALNTRGLSLRSKGMLQEAAATFRMAMSFEPDYWQAYFNLGLVLSESGDFDSATAAFKRAVELNPAYGDSQKEWAGAEYTWAEKLAREDKWDSAVAHYKEALRLRPDFPDAIGALAGAYARQAGLDARQQQLAAMAGMLAEAVRKNPTDSASRYQAANAFNDLGLYLRGRNQLDEAAAQFNAALGDLPEFWQAQFNLGLIMEDRGKPEMAIPYYRKAMRAEAGAALARVRLVNVLNNAGLILRSQNKLTEAEANFREALSLDANYWQAHFNLALVLDSRGLLQEAVKEYQKCLELNPSFLDATTYLNKALQEINAAAQHSP